MRLHALALLGDPTAGLDGFPVLRRKVVGFIVNHVIVHEFVDLVQIEERSEGKNNR